MTCRTLYIDQALCAGMYGCGMIAGVFSRVPTGNGHRSSGEQEVRSS